MSWMLPYAQRDSEICFRDRLLLEQNTLSQSTRHYTAWVSQCVPVCVCNQTVLFYRGCLFSVDLIAHNSHIM